MAGSGGIEQRPSVSIQRRTIDSVQQQPGKLRQAHHHRRHTHRSAVRERDREPLHRRRKANANDLAPFERAALPTHAPVVHPLLGHFMPGKYVVGDDRKIEQGEAHERQRRVDRRRPIGVDVGQNSDAGKERESNETKYQDGRPRDA